MSTQAQPTKVIKLEASRSLHSEPANLPSPLLGQGLPQRSGLLLPRPLPQERGDCGLLTFH